MAKMLPQEVEVWYLIPAIRRELTKILIKDHGLTQKKVSDILGLTESAVSQYIKSKRANTLQFNSDEMEKIKEYADKIMKDKENIKKYLFDLSIKLRGSDSLCKLHKKHDSSIDEHCKICIEKS